MAATLPRAVDRPVHVAHKDKERHGNAFTIADRNTQASAVCFFGLLPEKRRWCDALSNTVEVRRLNQLLEQAQRVDMFAAINAQVAIEAFEKSHQTEMAGPVQAVIRKKAKDANIKWKPCYAVLEGKSFTVYTDKAAADAAAAV
jgi:hypothetical protein